MNDVIIIGKGPAGLSAGLYLSRANKKVVIIGKNNIIWNKDVKINNYLGTGRITGKKLMENCLKQTKSFGSKIVDELIDKVEIKVDKFVVHANNKSYESKNLIIATGSPRIKKEISNEEDFIGKGVSYCVPCDGFFFKNKKVFLIGTNKYAEIEALELLNYSKDVTLVTNGKELKLDKKKLLDNGIKIETFKIEKIMEGEKVEKVKTSKGEKNVEGIFICSGDIDSNDLAKTIGIITKENLIVVDKDMKTNVPYIFAIGDCTPGLKQIAVAVSKGAIAATTIIKEGRK